MPDEPLFRHQHRIQCLHVHDRDDSFAISSSAGAERVHNLSEVHGRPQIALAEITQIESVD